MNEYLVQNNRPRRTVTVCGRLLAAKIRGGKSEVWLSEDEYSSTACQRLLSMGRLVCVGIKGEPVPAVDSHPEPIPAPKVEVAPAPEPESGVETDTLEEPERAREDDGTFVADDPATSDVNEAFEPPAPHTLESLMSKKKDALEDMCTALGLATTGTKKVLANRILESQEA